MELINKKDALHAVLHNTGDAAVAAVENIEAVDSEHTYRKLFLDLKEEHLELIRRLPKAFTEPQPYRYCPYCGNHGIHLRCDDVEFEARGIHVKCTEIVAECSTCEQEIYIPTINDWNCENREYAYQNAKTEREENNEQQS